MSNITAPRVGPHWEQAEKSRVKLGLVSEAAEGAKVWSPLPFKIGAVTTDQVLHIPIGALPAQFESRMIATLTRQIDPGEVHAVGAARRESELRTQLATLDATQSFHLKRRLDMARTDDSLCVAFQRLVADRRHRLLAFLEDARRRTRRK